MAELPGIQYDKANTYHKEVILKKEGKIWIEYYAVLVDKMLVFNRKDSKTGLIIPNNVTMIEISGKTNCGFDDHKKTCYRFPFWVETGKVKYKFKCETKLHRHKWLFAIRLCAGGKPPKPVPKMIPTVQRGKQQRKASEVKLNRSRNLTYSNNNSASSNNNNSGVVNKNKVDQKFTHKRSKSVDTCIEDARVKNQDQELQKSSSVVKDVFLKRSRSLNERTHKSGEKGKTPSWKLRFSKRSKSKPDSKDSVVENRNVKDSLSDVHLSASSNPSGHFENGIRKVKTIIVQSGARDDLNSKMTLNDRFKSMSCDDILQVERTETRLLTKSINGDTSFKEIKRLQASKQKSKSVDELYLDEAGRKTSTDYSEEGVVDLVDITDPKKQPCENDELDYPQQRPSSHSKRDITELFKATSTRRFSSSCTLDLAAESFHVSSSSLKRKSRKRPSIVSLFSLKMERANSWASFSGRKKAVEPLRRRENSAPSLKSNRITRMTSNC